MNSVTDESESRPVLGPAGNKARPVELHKPAIKVNKSKSKPAEVINKSPVPVTVTVITPAPTPQLKVRVSSSRRSVTPRRCNGLKTVVKAGKSERVLRGEKIESDGCLEASGDGSVGRKRCAWVTANTEPCYAVFHDEEWGVPVHDDKKLFKLLSLSTALAELTWPTILNKRNLFREVYHGFDPIIVSKMNDKKISAPGNPAKTLLSEVKLRGIIENARQVCKIADEFGSFDKYIWGFINHKPIVNKFRYARQVPIKTSKAESISKDLVKRGFRGVGPTAIYSFLQVAGLTNDHLVSCFRFNECVDVGPTNDIADGSGQNSGSESGNGLGLTGVIAALRLSGE
ncbi:uncharacterized protein LOC143562344 [Bidens hawaiensis]|uniref:uncharacterized protein LOC143562344 n=1 Tax=Bidens hawaiensis TaxID=980011 RepID=UPI00404B5509